VKIKKTEEQMELFLVARKIMERNALHGRKPCAFQNTRKRHVTRVGDAYTRG